MKSMLLRQGLLIFFCLLLVWPVAAEHTPLDAAAGRLLVASETMSDPRFAESVILLLQHDRSGSVGLVLNNRTELLPEEMSEQLVHGLRHVYFGGPVEPFAITVLYFGDQPPENSRKVLKGIHLTGINEINALLEQGEKVHFRVFLGYSGWGPGQLEMELALRSWQVYPADERVLAQENVEDLWQQLMGSGPVISL